MRRLEPAKPAKLERPNSSIALSASESLLFWACGGGAFFAHFRRPLVFSNLVPASWHHAVMVTAAPFFNTSGAWQCAVASWRQGTAYPIAAWTWHSRVWRQALSACRLLHFRTPPRSWLTRQPFLGWCSMLATAFFHGILIVGFLLVYGRWFDDEVLGEVCLYGLLVELLFALGSNNYLGVTDGVFLLDCGHPDIGASLLSISLLFCFDPLSGFFLGILTVALIFCFYFLAEYFEYDAGAGLIITLSALFSQLALLFFCAYDLMLLILFWELISLVSFLLVQHWSHRLPTYKAGLKVFSISQVGDLPLLLFIFFVVSRCRTSSLLEVLPTLPLVAHEFVVVGPVLVGLLSVWAILLATAVFLKAAQFFFYPWLLDAMEAPVPISAQLHSSTLVVIGFYLFFRFQLLFLLTPQVGILFLWLGLCTVVGASVLGFFQTDGKRLLACSTASQLGYVVTCLGLGLYEEALLLLAFCCCNKAATFVWFGALMHKFAGLSDFRFMGGQAPLRWFEHAGLLVSLSNFTVLPGAFSWHVKGLLAKGETPLAPFGAGLGLEVLQLTWFFSSLYLVALYLALFTKAAQGHASSPTPTGLSPTWRSVWQRLTRSWPQPWAPISQNLSPTSASFFVTALAVLVCLANPLAGGFITYGDMGWAAAELVAPLSYF